MLAFVFILVCAQPYDTNPLKIITNATFTIYQNTVSPSQGDVCNFSPSCSQYARQAILRYGTMWGTLMAADRLMRCNPWAYQYYGLYYRDIVDYKLADPAEHNYVFTAMHAPPVLDELQKHHRKIPLSSPSDSSTCATFSTTPLPSSAMFSQENILSFAEHLYLQEDYAAAVNEYRRYTMLADPCPDHIHERIIECLINLDQCEAALEQVNRLSDIEKKQYVKGWIFFSVGQFDSSRAYLNNVGIEYRQDAERLIGLGHAWQFRFSEAGEYLHLPQPPPYYKAPWVAGLCALFPGGGHFYCNRAGDGFFSLLMVSTAALISYYYYNEDEDLKFSIAFSSALILYAANIYGGVNAARNFNYYQNGQYLHRIIEENN